MLRTSAGIGALSIAMSFGLNGTAQAQDGPAATDVTQDIVVTARKRTETDIAVPVAITAVGSAEISRRGINNLEALSASVPALRIGPGGGSVQGGTITLRGLGSSADNPMADQSVSFNIDGAQVSRSSIQRIAQLDIAQVEVLRGPQALFFGKNSPGGIISIRTADPGSKFEAKISGGFEAIAREWRAEGMVSTPITDTLGIRIAAYGSVMRGWTTNLAPQSAVPIREHLPHDREFGGRVTLKYDPGGPFDARFKFTYNRVHGEGTSANDQPVSCVTPGVTQYGDVDDCTADNRVHRSNIPASYGQLDPVFRDGRPYHRQRQMLSSLEMNYAFSEAFKLTSVSSFYGVDYAVSENYTRTPNENLTLAAANGYRAREYGQEVRLAGSIADPLNFVIGGYYQHSDLTYTSKTAFGLLGFPALLFDDNINQKGDAISGFGQLIWNVTDQIELAGGGRYSHETKRITPLSFGQLTHPPLDRNSWNNFSPEGTITWRPSTNLTLFGAYKRGFLSGGFNGGPVGPTDARNFDQQLIRGFEAGVKARLFDGKVRTNLTAYSYEATGLQVTTTNTTPEGGVSQTTKNAGSARLRGIEFDANWETPLTGFTLRGSLAYTHARYKSFIENCYVGQSISEGCNVNQNPVTGAFTGQDFAGKQLLRAPDWTATMGFNYERPVGEDMVVSLSNDTFYTSRYYTAAIASPGSYQKGYWQFDASLRVAPQDRSWEVALIGVNLSNQYYYSASYESLFAPGPTGEAVPGRRADTIATVSRGRQVMMRLTKTF